MEDKDIKEEVLKEETNKETNEEIKNEEVKDETHEHKHGGHTCCGKHGHKHNDEEIGKLKAEIEEWKNEYLRKQLEAERELTKQFEEAQLKNLPLVRVDRPKETSRFSKFY